MIIDMPQGGKLMLQPQNLIIRPWNLPTKVYYLSFELEIKADLRKNASRKCRASGRLKSFL